MKNKIKTLFLKRALLWPLLTMSGYSYADCFITNSGNLTLPSIPSIALAESGQEATQFAAGLSCSGLGVGNTTYLKYKVNQKPASFLNRSTNEKLQINFSDINRNAIQVGREVDLTSFSLLNFFSGPNNSIPFYVQIPAGQIVSPGTYVSESPFSVKWYYSVPGLAVVGIGVFYQSPGFVRPGIFNSLNWGSGVDSSLSMQITVLPDCRISTNDVNFGTAAFAGAFEPVRTSMGIRCSAKTPYYVSLNNGLNPQNGNQRAMKSTTGNNYLSYDIYKNTSTERWGTGSERWSSANASSNPNVYDAKTQQSYAFTTKILPNNSNSLPAGTYTDTITVQVEF